MEFGWLGEEELNFLAGDSSVSFAHGIESVFNLSLVEGVQENFGSLGSVSVDSDLFADDGRWESDVLQQAVVHVGQSSASWSNLDSWGLNTLGQDFPHSNDEHEAVQLSLEVSNESVSDVSERLKGLVWKSDQEASDFVSISLIDVELLHRLDEDSLDILLNNGVRLKLNFIIIDKL